MARFLINLGYAWPSISTSGGYVFNASAVNKEQGERRDFEYYEGQWLLFDPQLYLASLDGDNCKRTCAKLSTYPWFGIEVPEFNSGEMKQADWFNEVMSNFSWTPEIPDDDEEILEVVRECLAFQRDFGVTHLIAPTPLVENAEDEFSVQLRWLEAALSMRKEFDIPIFATVAINEYLLAHHDPNENVLLQSILDNLTASEFNGLYMLVAQEAAEKARFDERRVAESLMYVSYIAGRRSTKDVLINYADDLGYACLATGSVGFASGVTLKQRRLCFSDFIDRGGGSAYPRFYSHSLIRDLLTESDLDRIRDARLMRLIRNDVTEESQPLLRALGSGAGASSVPNWTQSRNNVGQANQHRFSLLGRVTNSLAKLGVDDRSQLVLGWLQYAEAHAALIDKKFSEEPLSEDAKHITAWREAFENTMDIVDGF